MIINVFTDGGSRGNPGHAAIGVHIENGTGEEITSFGKKIGVTTNNVAEYKAVIAALDFIIEDKKQLSGVTKIQFFMDSLLICSQINGLYKVKSETLRSLLFEIREREARIKIPLYYSHIRRELNKKADRMVNNALDAIEL